MMFAAIDARVCLRRGIITEISTRVPATQKPAAQTGPTGWTTCANWTAMQRLIRYSEILVSVSCNVWSVVFIRQSVFGASQTIGNYRKLGLMAKDGAATVEGMGTVFKGSKIDAAPKTVILLCFLQSWKHNLSQCADFWLRNLTSRMIISPMVFSLVMTVATSIKKMLQPHLPDSSWGLQAPHLPMRVVFKWGWIALISTTHAHMQQTQPSDWTLSFHDNMQPLCAKSNMWVVKSDRLKTLLNKFWLKIDSSEVLN